MAQIWSEAYQGLTAPERILQVQQHPGLSSQKTRGEVHGRLNHVDCHIWRRTQPFALVTRQWRIGSTVIIDNKHVYCLSTTSLPCGGVSAKTTQCSSWSLQAFRVYTHFVLRFFVNTSTRIEGPPSDDEAGDLRSHAVFEGTIDPRFVPDKKIPSSYYVCPQSQKQAAYNKD